MQSYENNVNERATVLIIAASGRAVNGDLNGLALQGLEDHELARVFSHCCGADQVIRSVQAWRDSGRSFEEFMSLAYLTSEAKLTFSAALKDGLLVFSDKL
jgi:hypothetical protein